MKIQTKITALFSIMFTSIITILSFGIYYFTYKNASQDFYTRLELRARIAARANLAKDHGTAAFEEIRREHLKVLPNEREFLIDTDTLSRVQTGSHDKGMPADFIRAIYNNGKASYRNEYDFYFGIRYNNGGNKFIVIISAENGELKGFLDNLQKILVTGCVASVILIFSLGLFFSRQILAPIRNITRQVQRITGTSLHLRLNIKKGKDEIAMLTNTFNNMLDRLETAFETQNNFVSNASHELNTPLTAIIGEADYALAKSRSQEQYQQSLTIILQQGDKLKNITESLLQLARAGFQENFTMETVNINDLIHNVKLNVSNVYSTCEVETIQDSNQVKNSALVTGNQQLLELALSNVVLNACKYSNCQPVTISLEAYGNHLIFRVTDKGIGIPKDEIKNIFDPFFRASNVKSIKGYGIGLPLTQNIIRLHKGSIEIMGDEGTGTEVIIKLPLTRN